MRIIALFLIFPIALAACSLRQPIKQNAELDSLKGRCFAQDFDACADIAHLAKQPPVDY